MKANEFVKLRGISYCKDLLIKADGCAAIQAREDNSRVSVDDLKRLVEAHEIIGLFKSLDHAKVEAQACEHSKHSEILVKLNVGVGYIWLSRVKQAIADVESCQ